MKYAKAQAIFFCYSNHANLLTDKQRYEIGPSGEGTFKPSTYVARSGNMCFLSAFDPVITLSVVLLLSIPFEDREQNKQG